MSSIALNSHASQGVSGGVSDEKQIVILINRLVSNAKTQDLLDPSYSGDKLKNQIQHFDGRYEISFVAKGPIQISGTKANVPVHIIFITSIGSSNEEKFEEDRTLDFVLRDGHWYFANFNFLNLTPMEFLIEIGLLLISTIWLCGTWLKFNTLRKRRMEGSLCIYSRTEFSHVNPPNVQCGVSGAVERKTGLIGHIQGLFSDFIGHNQGLYSDFFHALNPFTWFRKETKEESEQAGRSTFSGLLRKLRYRF
jgi:hypothetical protein